MRSTTSLSLILATALGAWSGPSTAEEPKGDLARLQGTWSSKVGPNKDVPATLIVKGDSAEVVVKRPDGDDIRLKGKVKVDDQASPKTLDWVEFTTPQGDAIPANRAIYKLDGDNWTVCSGGPGNDRPSKFEAGEGGPPMLNTWARLKAKDKEPEKAAEKPIAGDQAKFQGTWTAKANGDLDITVTFQGNAVTARWVVREDGTAVDLKGEMRINDQATPRTVDFFHFQRADGEETKDNLGIYAFEGDQVKICVGGPGAERPTEIKAGSGGTPTLLVLSRKPD